MARVTLEEFLRRSNERHGGIYDYSQVDFKNTSTKVEIICSKHGSFWQTPTKHMDGAGCPNKECVVARRQATMVDRYGAPNALQSPEILQAMRSGMVEKYGAANPMQIDSFREKHRETCRERFGTDTPLESPEVREKITATMEKLHGGRGAMCDAEVRSKSAATNLAKYGVVNPMQNAGIQEKQQDGLEASLGVRNPMKDDAVKVRQRESQRVTMLERYGADSGFGSPVLREKAAETCLRKYGARNAMQLKDFSDKMTAAKIANGTTNTSMPEDLFYQMLCDRFGDADVVRQHVSEQYPHACDFYIKSRDMYIELNASWTHGGGWFDDRADDTLLRKLQLRAGMSEYYASALRTWTVLDVAKRRDAQRAGLNYLTFWDSDLQDAKRWFEQGCPDGRDYFIIHSWEQESQGDLHNGGENREN